MLGHWLIWDFYCPLSDTSEHHQSMGCMSDWESIQHYCRVQAMSFIRTTFQLSTHRNVFLPTALSSRLDEQAMRSLSIHLGVCPIQIVCPTAGIASGRSALLCSLLSISEAPISKKNMWSKPPLIGRTSSPVCGGPRSEFQRACYGVIFLPWGEIQEFEFVYRGFDAPEYLDADFSLMAWLGTWRKRTSRELGLASQRLRSCCMGVGLGYGIPYSSVLWIGGKDAVEGYV